MEWLASGYSISSLYAWARGEGNKKTSSVWPDILYEPAGLEPTAMYDTHEGSIA